jgi:hypothetical protein
MFGVLTMDEQAGEQRAVMLQRHHHHHVMLQRVVT